MQPTHPRRPEYVPNFYAYKLKVTGRALTKAQKKQFFDGLNKIHRENPTIIYRGDKKSTLLPLYHLQPDQFPSAFNDAVFLMGAKARQFTGDLVTGPFAIDIAGTAGNEFRLIFRMLGNLLSRVFPFGGLRFRVVSFKKDESDLTAFFRTPDNERRFVQILGTFEPAQRIAARDYYLALLHHISKSQYYSSSFLLSTTTSFPLAHKFAWSKEEGESTDPLIFFGWVPNNYEGILSAPDIRTIKKKVDLEAAGLPVYHRSFFPYQQEVTLKGGLLPIIFLATFTMTEPTKYSRSIPPSSKQPRTGRVTNCPSTKPPSNSACAKPTSAVTLASTPIPTNFGNTYGRPKLP